MAKIKKIKLPDDVTYDIADASIATMGNNTDTDKENKNVVSDYIASRAENLLTNGTSLLGNNYNFSTLTYDGSDTYYAAGSFRKDKPAAYWSFVNDEFIPVDVNATYRFDFYTKSTKTGTAPQFNGMIKAYDIDKKEIASYQVSPRANTLTTLAQDLKPGDTKVYFTSIANFSKTNLTTNNSSLLFYGYKNSFGYEYEPETYTQYRYASLWSTVEQMDFENNTITLNQPWPSSRPTFLAGTPVSQGQDGSGALYCSVNDVSITYTETPGVWEHCWYHINGLQAKNTFPTSQFPFGTAYIKVGLMNRLVYGTGESFWISTMSFTTVGASVDQVKAGTTTTYNYDYPLLFKSQKNANTEIANTQFADVTYNPYSKTLKINGTSIAPGTLNTTATTSQATKSSESLRGAITLHKVSKTGSYNDLLDKPTLTRDVFWCTYGTTTYQEISDEVTAGRLPVVHYSDKDYVYYGPNGNYLYFTTTLTNNGYYVRVDNNNTWASGSLVFEKTSNKTTALSDLSTDTQYPTAKAVYDAIEDVREIAEGRKTAYVISAVTNPIFNTDEPTIEVASDVTDVDGRTIALAGLSKGDVFYVTESGIPDRWVGDNQAIIMPEGYTRLAYIEGTGTQYLNTGVIPTTPDLSMTLDMMWTGTVLQDFESFGGFMASGTTPRFGISKYSGKYMFGINTTTSPNSPIPDNRRHVLRCYSDNAQQMLYVDGALVASTGVSASALSTNTLPIWLFARNSASANIAKMRLYGATIAVAGEIYNYVPCLNPNNEVGIYDLNHDTFIKSAVATQFVAGSTMTNAIQMYALDSSQIDLDSFYTKAQTNALLGEKQNLINAQNPLPYAYLSGAPNLATVATTGSYNDLSDTPTLAAVATSGDYEDLSNTPTIPDVSNFVERNELATVATTGSYTDLANTPAIIGDVRVNGTTVVDINNVAQVTVPTQTSDLTNNSGFITNATDSLTNYTKTSDLAAVATSGAYNDLSGKPSLATVATSGSYNDLSNTPLPELFYCTYGTTTTTEIATALAAGQLPVCVYPNSLSSWTNPVFIYCGSTSTYMGFAFCSDRQAFLIKVTKSNNTWSFNYDSFEF